MRWLLPAKKLRQVAPVRFEHCLEHVPGLIDRQSAGERVIQKDLQRHGSITRQCGLHGHFLLVNVMRQHSLHAGGKSAERHGAGAGLIDLAKGLNDGAVGQVAHLSHVGQIHKANVWLAVARCAQDFVGCLA